MIQIILEPKEFFTHKLDELTINLLNTSHEALTNIVFGLKLPSSVRIQSGKRETIRVQRLVPNEVIKHTIQIVPLSEGTPVLTIINLHYRDASGKTQQSEDTNYPITVKESLPAKQQKTDDVWSAESKTTTSKPLSENGTKLKPQNLQLDPNTINELIEILQTFMEDEKSRRSFLMSSLGNNAILQHISWSGAVAVFIPHMVCKLAACRMPSGKQALWVLLEYARSQLGSDVQQRIDKLSPLINL